MGGFAFPSRMFEPQDPTGAPDETQHLRSLGLGGSLAEFGPGVIGDYATAFGDLLQAAGGNFLHEPRSPFLQPAPRSAATSNVAATAASKMGMGGEKSAPSPQARAGGGTTEIPHFPERPLVFQPPKPLSEFRGPERGSRIAFVRDPSGQIIHARTVDSGEPQELGGMPMETVERAPDDPVFGRIDEVLRATDERDPIRRERAFNSMSPFEQQLGGEALMRNLPMLAERQQQRQMSLAEQAQRDVATGQLEGYAGKQLLEEQAVQRRVLQGKSPQEWINDRGLGYAQGILRSGFGEKHPGLDDPAAREKAGLPPTKATPQEAAAAARQGNAMAQQQLDYLLMAAQFPTMFRFPERPPQEP